MFLGSLREELVYQPLGLDLKSKLYRQHMVEEFRHIANTRQEPLRFQYFSD